MKKVFASFLIVLATHVPAVVYQQPTAQFKPRIEIEHKGFTWVTPLMLKNGFIAR